MTPDERATEVVAPLAKMAARGRPVPLGMLLETLSADIAAAITAAVEAEREACRQIAEASLCKLVIHHEYRTGYDHAVSDIAAAIAARGKGEN